MLHFRMDFNNFHLSPISSFLHRSARSTIPAVARTCRFCGVKNDTNFQRILTIPLFVAMSPSKLLLSPMVLGTCSKRHQFCIVITLCNHSCQSRYIDSNLIPQWIFNVFVWTLFGIVFAKLTKWQRAGRNMVCSKALMFTKRKWA